MGNELGADEQLFLKGGVFCYPTCNSGVGLPVEVYVGSRKAVPIHGEGLPHSCLGEERFLSLKRFHLEHQGN